ncbi:uncharacterized protein P884DRAFT_301537 [Thermothelomyces heterothallicus CBS 202.75]|uniref:uncharacterized protein n=1 Tax=Thermothelomyces heterothallicus CBS 202.75 TaxID=1149848 RepID=UPI003742548E
MEPGTAPEVGQDRHPHRARNATPRLAVRDKDAKPRTKPCDRPPASASAPGDSHKNQQQFSSDPATSPPPFAHHHHHRFHPQTLRPALLNAASSVRSIHTSNKDWAIDWPTNLDPRSHSNRVNKPAIEENIGRKRFGDFNVTGKVFVVTGAAQGLRLAMPEVLVEAGGKGLLSPVCNSSKAAVIQLARNLAMEWSPVREDGSGGIRVNCISPGHILTPMVRKNFEEVPGTTEFKGAVLFLLSNASSFMTGSNLVIDGGHTAW